MHPILVQMIATEHIKDLQARAAKARRPADISRGRSRVHRRLFRAAALALRNGHARAGRRHLLLMSKLRADRR